MSPSPAPEPLFLNVGCGDHKLPGFVNLDLDPAADVQVDVTQGLPYAAGTVQGIFSEHFIEHLTQAQGVAFFRECRRVLANGGRMRVATPDLDYLVEVYATDWRRNLPEWSRYGYDWIANRAEQLNLVMREWEHRWLYNEEELVRLATLAGLTPLERCRLGASGEPRFRGVDYREGSTLIYEFVKSRPAVRTDDPLVSVVITAYNPRYLREALESALSQSYRHIEVVIGDDRTSGEIGAIVSGVADDRIRYHRNERNLGEKENLIACFARARGEYVKFLNDDDALHPECVERMVRCLHAHPDVTLVTSHRQPIDAAGRPLPDIPATRRPVTADSVIDGVSLARALLESGLNFVGEPSTAMFRRADLASARPNILSFAGRECIGTVDVTMWTHLLSQGDAIYLVDSLSRFRLHAEQAQRSDEYVQRQAGPARQQILFDAKRMGLLERTGPITIPARPLAGSADAGRGAAAEAGGPEVRAAEARVPAAGAAPARAAAGPAQATAPAGTAAAAPDPHAPRVSIVIPVFNRLALTRACLQAIARNTPAGAHEVVIVDNGSTDGTAEALRSLPPGTVRVVSNPENLGFARACNQGARAAAGDYLLFLNNDTEPEPEWLEPLVAVLDGDPEVAAVGSRLLYPDRTIQHAGVIVIEDRAAGSQLVARHVHAGKPADAPEANRPSTYQALTAACLLVRASAFFEAGGFDEGYWNGYEDVDLCFALGATGRRLVYEPRSVVIHHESQSGPERFRRAGDNVARLQERWRGKIAADVVIEAGGTTRRTGAGKVRVYAPPGGAQPAAPAPARSAAAQAARAPSTAPGLAPAPAAAAGTGPGSASRAASAPATGIRAERLPGVVSIVILTMNQLRYTRECIASIQHHTPEPHEIVFVDNGSSDGTVRWIEQQVRQHPNYRLIRNPSNLGFAKGCNQGIEDSRGEYILLLNNDVVVTPGWLGGLLECLSREPRAGFVGPMTNRISGPQQLPEAGYASPTGGLDDFARAFRERHRGRRLALRRIVGFCMLFRSDLARTVGLLDERFGSGNYEDDDYCLRATLLGMKNLVAGDVFVHHHGSRTFLGNRMDFGHAMTGNRRRFSGKWSAIGLDTPLGSRLHAVQSIERAADLHAGGRTGPAIETLVEALKHAPADRALHEAMAAILLDAGHFKEGLELLGGLPADAGDLDAVIRLGLCHEGLGNAGEADACADRALAIDPRSAGALDLKGRAARARGDLAAARGWFERAHEADPGLGAPLTQLGLLALDAGRDAEGLDLAERGFVLAPGAGEATAAYHSAVTAAGAWERATPVLAEARALRPTHRRVAFFLIEALIRRGLHAAAMEAIEGAMAAFGADDGLLSAALGVRGTLGPLEPAAADPSRGRLSLCMIVKDEADRLARCLASVRPIVAEIVVVDTGSTDRTRDLATAFGAKVFDHPWTGDFSEARNLSLSKATGDTILIMDADEVIAARDLETLAALAAKRGRKAHAWSFVTRNYMVPVYNAGWTANDGSYPAEEAGTGWFPSTKVRLFPNRRNVRFRAPVHEVVEPSLAELGIPVRPAGIPVHHYGKLNEADDRRKGEAYFELGLRKVEALGEDVVAISELAIQARALGRYDEAVELWKRVLSIRADLPIAWFNMGSALIELGRHDEARTACARAAALDSGHKEIAYNAALVELYAGEARASLAALEGVVKRWPDYPAAQALRVAALWCAGRAGDAAAPLAALRRDGFDVAGYVAVVAGHLTGAGRDDLARTILDSAREAGLAAAAAHPVPAARP